MPIGNPLVSSAPSSHPPTSSVRDCRRRTMARATLRLAGFRPCQRTRVANRHVDDDVVVLRGGSYAEAVRMGPEDSGITVTAAPGESPEMSGAVKLNATWTRATNKKGNVKNKRKRHERMSADSIL